MHGGGLFVLARTSNPDAGTFQHALVGERSVAQVVVDTVRGWNTPGWVVGDPLPDIGAVRDLASRFGPTTGSFGVVVGATLRDLDVDLDGLGGPILAPGLGAQGGSVADLRRLFGTDRAVVPTVSRDVLAAGPDPAALRAAADRWTAELAGERARPVARQRPWRTPACRPSRRVASSGPTRAGIRFRNRSVRNPALTCGDDASSPRR